MERLFDTHAHYFDRKFEDLDGGADALLSSEEFKAIVGGVINVGTDPENARTVIEQSKKYDFMYAAVGIHPSDAQNRCKRSIEEELYDIEALICDKKTRKANKIVALGEIGFDYYWQPVNKPLQYEYFDHQMCLAKKYGLVPEKKSKLFGADVEEPLAEEVSSDSEGFSTRATMVCFFTIGILIP